MRMWKDKSMVSENEGDNPHIVVWVTMTNMIRNGRMWKCFYFLNSTEPYHWLNTTIDPSPNMNNE
jgi:hypothetical protein